MKFLEMFEKIKKGNSGLTGEAIYKSIQNGVNFVPIWGGNKEHNSIERRVTIDAKTKFNKPITIFQGEGIILSLDGSAGSMTFKHNQKFALNHHAGFCKVKDTTKIIPEFFALFYQKLLKEMSVSEGSKTLTQDQIYAMDFDVPSLSDQRKIMKTIKPVLDSRKKLLALNQKTKKLKKLILAENYKKFQVKDFPVNSLFDYMSGNSGLTEKTIYQKIPLKGDRYTVLSSSTDTSTKLGEIPKCKINEKEIKVFESNRSSIGGIVKNI